MRGLPAPEMVPKAELLKLVFGLFRLVWLRALKNSARNWKLHCSRIGKFLNNPMSHQKSPGPRKLFLPTVPKVPAAGLVNATFGAEFSQFSQCCECNAAGHAPC